jgi:hypothetical protein
VTDVGVAAFLDNGQRDVSFGSQGLTVIDVASDQATGVAVDDQDRLIIAADAWDNPGFLVIRLTAGGGRDSSFGDSGVVLTSAETGTRANAGVIATPQGLVLAGETGNTTMRRTLIARYLH